MAGFPLYAIGSALSGFMQGYDQDQKRAQQQQLQQMQQREVMQKLKQQQQADQATGLAFQALVAGGLDPNNQGKQLPTGAPPMPGQASTPNAMLDYGIDSDSAPTKQLASLTGGATPYSDAPAPGGSIGTGPKVSAPFPASQAADIYSGPDQALGGQTQPPPPPRQPDPVRYAMAASGAQPGNAPVSVPQMTGNVPSPNAQPSNVGPPTPADKPPQWPGINAPAGQQQANPAMAQAALNQMVPPPIQHAAKSIAVQAANQSPTQVYGGANIQQMAQAIDKANPGAPPAVKFLALSQYVKLMAPEEKQQYAMMMLQQRQEMQLALKQMQIDAANQRALQGPKGTPQILTDPSNNQQYIMNPARPGSATDLQGKPYTPGGAQKLGGPPKPGDVSTPAPKSEVEYWTKVLNNGGSLPPGITRTRQGSDLVRQVMANMSESGDPNQFIANKAATTADSRSLSNMVKMADAATSFEKTASQNFDLALKLSKDAIPTDWGPWLNKWIESGQTQFGDTNVPPYVTAMLTGANEYAKIMSGSTGAQGSTVDSRREAAELFSPYLSQGQIDRVVAVAKQDMQNRKSSLYGQVDDIKGRLGSAGSGQPTATQGQTQSGLPSGLPDPKGLPEGKGLADDSGKIIAIIRNGQWEAVH